jgi:single-stranded DNA-binding protein
VNIVLLTGRLTSNARLRGKKARVLAFTVETKQKIDNEQEERSSFVPCVAFNVPTEIEAALLERGQSQFVELQGRITTTDFETAGERQHSVEVIVFNKSLTLRDVA